MSTFHNAFLLKTDGDFFFSKDKPVCVCVQGVNKDSYLILETLPTEYDSRVKAMEVDERPTEQYSDIGGLDKQIQEVPEFMYLFNLFNHWLSLKITFMFQYSSVFVTQIYSLIIILCVCVLFSWWKQSSYQ